MLVRDPAGRWVPGPAARRAGPRAPDVLLTAAEPMLTRLRDGTGESAQLYLRAATSGSASPPPSGPAACATPCPSAPCCR